MSDRLPEGGLFRVKHFSDCYSHSGADKIPSKCIRCRLDMELRWFVKALGGVYTLSEM